MVAPPPAARVSSTAPDLDVPAPQDHGRSSLDDDTKKELSECVETISQNGGYGNEAFYIPPEEIQGRFPLLRDLSKEQMEALNKKVVSKLDWRMMPCVTLMFLMK